MSPVLLPALARAAVGDSGVLIASRRSRAVHVADVPRRTATGRLPRATRPVCGQRLRAPRPGPAGGVVLPLCKRCASLLLTTSTTDLTRVLTVDELRAWLATADTAADLHLASIAALRHGSVLIGDIGAAKRRLGVIVRRDPNALPPARRREPRGRRAKWWQDPAAIA